MKVVYALNGEFLIPRKFFDEYGIPHRLNEYGAAFPVDGDKTDYHKDQRLAAFVEARGEYNPDDNSHTLWVDQFCAAKLCAIGVPAGCYFRITHQMDPEGYHEWDVLDIFDPQNPDGWTLAE